MLKEGRAGCWGGRGGGFNIHLDFPIFLKHFVTNRNGKLITSHFDTLHMNSLGLIFCPSSVMAKTMFAIKSRKKHSWMA